MGRRKTSPRESAEDRQISRPRQTKQEGALNEVEISTTQLTPLLRDATLLSVQQYTMAPKPLLFVASLGNPTSTYAHTLHSAGHTALKSLALRLRYPSLSPRSSVSHPSFGRSLPPDSDLSPSEDVASRATLWMSPVLMNVSGPAVIRAWKSWLATTEDKGRERKLVIVHDELEAALGAVKVRAGSLSARGHNGIKSVQGALKGMGAAGRQEFFRIGVGISRPAGREKDEVSNWVLRKMTPNEAEVLEGEEVTGRVVDVLSRIGA
ncbi:MAG: diphosphomevalonate decarboxylase [Chaenotheca gracillima]|nr:MAG: diphosphomevalonate decarboxylase [Chaenotheca gracillima]